LGIDLFCQTLFLPLTPLVFGKKPLPVFYYEFADQLFYEGNYLENRFFILSFTMINPAVAICFGTVR